MKHYILALVVLCSLSLAAPVMAATLTATQTSYTEMWVTGTGFTPDVTVTLSTETSIPVTPSGDAYSYEITGIYLPAGSVLALDASPVNDDLELYVKGYWPLVWTFDKSYGSTIGYSYDSPTGTVHVDCSIPSLIAGTFQTVRVYGTTAYSDVDLNVTVEQGVTADGSGSFSETVDISAIPAGDYEIRATDGINTATTQVTIYAPGTLHHITITNPETGDLTLNTTEDYAFGATGYDFTGVVVQNVAFIWTSSSTYVETINSTTGYFAADTAGNTEVYARSGTKETNHVIVYVNAPTVTETITNGEGNATSGDSTADVTLNDTMVSGTITITEIGDPVNSTLFDAGGNDTTLGLGGPGANQLIKGVVVDVDPSILDALSADAVNGTSWVQIRMDYDQSVIDSLGIDESTLNIWKYNDTTYGWELVKNQPYCLGNGRDMTTNYLWVNVTHLCSFALVGATIPPPSGGGGGEGTYPPGWFGTPTPTSTPTPPPGVTPSPVGEKVTPSPTKPVEAGKTPTAPVKETPTKKKGIPGFTAVFAIAGMLAIAYMVMRRRR